MRLSIPHMIIFALVILLGCSQPPQEQTAPDPSAPPPAPDYAKLPLPAALEEADLEEDSGVEDIDFAAHENFAHVAVWSGDQIVSASGRPDNGWIAAPPLVLDVTIPETVQHAHVFAVEVVDGGVEGTFQSVEVAMITDESAEWHVPEGVKTSDWMEDLPGGRKGKVYAFKFGHEHPTRVRVTIPQGTVYSPNQVHVDTLRVLGDHEP